MIDKNMMYFFAKEAEEILNNETQEKPSNLKRNLAIGGGLLAAGLGVKHLLGRSGKKALKSSPSPESAPSPKASTSTPPPKKMSPEEVAKQKELHSARDKELSELDTLFRGPEAYEKYNFSFGDVDPVSGRSMSTKLRKEEELKILKRYADMGDKKSQSLYKRRKKAFDKGYAAPPPEDAIYHEAYRKAKQEMGDIDPNLSYEEKVRIAIERAAKASAIARKAAGGYTPPNYL